MQAQLRTRSSRKLSTGSFAVNATDSDPQGQHNLYGITFERSACP